MKGFTLAELEQLRECVGLNTSNSMEAYGEPVYPSLYGKLTVLIENYLTVEVGHE